MMTPTHFPIPPTVSSSIGSSTTTTTTTTTGTIPPSSPATTSKPPPPPLRSTPTTTGPPFISQSSPQRPSHLLSPSFSLYNPNIHHSFGPGALGSGSPPPLKPPFPPHNAPRIWFISSITSPIALSLARVLLAHGDYVVGTANSSDLGEPRDEHFRIFLADIKTNHVDGLLGGGGGAKRMADRFKLIPLDRRIISQCQSSLATAAAAFGRIDILVCFTEDCLVGAVEETIGTDPSLPLPRDTFDINFFSNVNLIKSVLPIMRHQNTGHIIALTTTSSQLAIPSMGLTCASQWALEGYCDSLAYECAPFNIRVSIIQPSFETRILTSRLTVAPILPDYAPEVNQASKVRQTIDSLINRLSVMQPVRTALPSIHGGSDPPPPPSRVMSHDSTLSPQSINTADRIIYSSGSIQSVQSGIDSDTGSTYSSSTILSPPVDIAAAAAPHHTVPSDRLTESAGVTCFFPPLTVPLANAIVAETVFAITAIGGHDNPPLHHIVGQDGISDAREKERMIRAEIAELGPIAQLGKNGS